MTSNAYKVLGLNESQKPSFDTIHLTYYALALKFHPDKNSDDVAAATEKFQEIQGAYAVLKKEFELLGDEFNAGSQGSRVCTCIARKRKGPKPIVSQALTHNYARSSAPCFE